MPSPGTDGHTPGHPADRAVRALMRLHAPQAGRKGLTAQQAVDAVLRQSPPPSPADSSLITELVYGSLRCEIRLWRLLSLHLRKPDKLPLLMRTILIVACYELLHLDRVPAYAAVNWAVQSVRDHLGAASDSGRRAAPPEAPQARAGLNPDALPRVANAVLRTIARLGDAPRKDAWYAEQVADPVERLSVVRSLPPWIARLWLQAYGPDAADALGLAAGQTPWPAVRINMARPGWEEVRAALIQDGGEAAEALGPAGIVFPPGQTPGNLAPLAESGALSRQGAGSQRLLRNLRAGEWQGPVWDACAGRGNKTCALLEMGKDVRLASDPHGPRLAALRRELDRLDLPRPEPRPEVRQGPAWDIDPGFAPRTILVDAPCSGLGALARRPDTRLYQTREQAQELAATQRAILDATWDRLAPGGRLAYMTCTVNPAENEEQTARLLARPDARLEIEIPARPMPHGEDSMYGALLRKDR